MSISNRPIKRRRLNDSNSALSKPFKSPLIAADRSGEDRPRANPSNAQHHTDNQSARTDTSQLNTQSTPTPIRKPTKTFLSPTPSQKVQDPQYITLQKTHSSLSHQLTALRHSLDIAQQALRITSSSTNTDLEALIHKWKLASREAAEEVFCGAKDRVNGMGGMRVWRERSCKRVGEQWGEQKEDVGGGSEEQREDLEIQKEELEAERRKYEPEKVQKVQESDDDDDSFTMDMMLRSLNIELDVIGYDKENQRWCD